MKNCATVNEVKAFAEKYNRSRLNNAMVLFVDKTGDYVVIEGDTLITGNDPYYVLSNFRPSETANLDDIKLASYHKGINLLKSQIDSSFQFCAAVMDTMKICRQDLGDGTLYTSVYDLYPLFLFLYILGYPDS